MPPPPLCPPPPSPPIRAESSSNSNRQVTVKPDVTIEGIRHGPPKTNPIAQRFQSLVRDVDDLGALCAAASNAHLVPKFIVSACDGIGCVFIAANALRWERLAAIAVENESTLADAVASHCPDIVHIADLTKVSAEEIASHMPPGKEWEMWFMGGPPCQPFSALGAQGLWNDPKSKPLVAFLELRDRLQVMCTRKAVRFRWFMEEVASMPKDVVIEISNLAHCMPVFFDAGDFGWALRPRLWWLGDITNERAKYAVRQLPFLEIHLAGTLIPHSHVVRWNGPRIPAEPPVELSAWSEKGRCGKQGLKMEGSSWSTVYPDGRFLCFTTAFENHPKDRGDLSDPLSMDSFSAFDGIYPLGQFKSGNCIDDASAPHGRRPLNLQEREAIMGFPPGWTSPLPEKPGSKHQFRRLSAVGNGWHVPCAIIIMFLASVVQGNLGEFPASMPWNFSSPAGSWSSATQSMVDGEFGLQPDVELTHSAWFQDMVSMLPARLPEELMQETWLHFQLVQIEPMLAFRTWKGRPVHHGTDIESVRTRQMADRQINIAGAHGLPPPLLSPTLTQEEHLQQAMDMKHPFTFEPAIECDLQYAIQRATSLGPDAVPWRTKVMANLRTLSRALKSLDILLLSMRPVQHVLGMNPAFMAALISVLKWPDRSLPMGLVAGFQIVGDLEPSLVLRQIPCTNTDTAGEQFFGHVSARIVEDLCQSSRPLPRAADIHEATLEEQGLGLCGPFMTAAELNSKYGIGQWRPLPRHIIDQSDGCGGLKRRPIDNGRSLGHNASTRVTETIFCHRPDWTVFTSKAVYASISARLPDLPIDLVQSAGEWVTVVGGTEDLWKGYRQNHAILEHAGAAIITYVEPGGERLFAELFGMPFGMSASVNQFNRAPHLFTAVQRRILALLAAHYFDDSILLEFRHMAAQSKTMTVRLFGYFGAILSHNKRQSMTATTKFLGQLTDQVSAWKEGAMCVMPVPATRRKAEDLLKAALFEDVLSATNASKIRGLLQWIDIGLHGRPCRGALSALIATQYWSFDATLRQSTKAALQYLLMAVKLLPGRIVQLAGPDEPHMVLYTDASTTGPTNLRVGLLLYRRCLPALASVIDIPLTVQNRWASRGNYIALGEVVAGPLACIAFAGELRKQDLLWFVDNVGAAVSLIKAGSPSVDCSTVALAANLLLLQLQTRTWFEWLASAQNPSDGLSRAGWDDVVVQCRLRDNTWTRREVVVPWDVILGDFSALCEMVTALDF